VPRGSLLERGAEAVQPRLPRTAVHRQPPLELAERLRSEGVKTPLSVRPHGHEPRALQNAEMPGDTGLVDPRLCGDVTDRLLPMAQGLDDLTARSVSQGLKRIYLHGGIYISSCIYRVKGRSKREEDVFQMN
jgi:hypothetical protein